MTDTLRQMGAQGWELSPDDVAALSPHSRDNVLRFGDYDTATLHIPPGPYDSALRLPADGLAVTGRRAGAVAAHPAPRTGTD
jgi:hypothetical protein